MLTSVELVVLVLAAILGSLGGLVGGFLAAVVRDRRLRKAIRQKKDDSY